MYGLGLIRRRVRYTSRESAPHAVSKRRETTTWKISPSTMACLPRSIADMNSSRSQDCSTAASRSTGPGGATDTVVRSRGVASRLSIDSRRATASW